MLQHPTLDQLKHLKLHGMARAFAELGDNPQAGELDHAPWLALLLDREEAECDDRRLWPHEFMPCEALYGRTTGVGVRLPYAAASSSPAPRGQCRRGRGCRVRGRSWGLY